MKTKLIIDCDKGFNPVISQPLEQLLTGMVAVLGKPGTVI
jgi:hypothetical protein